MDSKTEQSSYFSVMKKSKTSFYYSSIILPEDKRNALRIIYAFCRMTDDISDNTELTKDEKIIKLSNWKKELEFAMKGETKNEFFILLKKYKDKFNISHQYFFDLIKGMEMDIIGREYETFAALEEYCYLVASTVGLMSISIFGYEKKETEEYAIKLGIAMQLTNIMRDVYKDVQSNRLYLPLNELKKFGVTQNDIKNKNYNINFINLMKYQYERAEKYYNDADVLLTKNDLKTLLPAKIMEGVYYKLLQKIRKNEFNIFNKEIRINKISKIFISIYMYLKFKILYR